MWLGGSGMVASYIIWPEPPMFLGVPDHMSSCASAVRGLADPDIHDRTCGDHLSVSNTSLMVSGVSSYPNTGGIGSWGTIGRI